MDNADEKPVEITFPIVVKLIKPIVRKGSASGIETVIDTVTVAEEPTAKAFRTVMRASAPADRLFALLLECTDLPRECIDALGMRDLLRLEEELSVFFQSRKKA